MLLTCTRFRLINCKIKLFFVNKNVWKYCFYLRNYYKENTYGNKIKLLERFKTYTQYWHIHICTTYNHARIDRFSSSSIVQIRVANVIFFENLYSTPDPKHIKFTFVVDVSWVLSVCRTRGQRVICWWWQCRGSSPVPYTPHHHDAGYRLHPPWLEMMSDVICQRRARTTSGHGDARPWSNYNACSQPAHTKEQ